MIDLKMPIQLFIISLVLVTLFVINGYHSRAATPNNCLPNSPNMRRSNANDTEKEKTPACVMYWPYFYYPYYYYYYPAYSYYYYYPYVYFYG